ncbi:lipoprotein-releasing ABC transporter permease subunit [Candidatus Aminicenantes bacterium AC-708-M15]|jgi:lipoprotein-releasing system permease protein|nr:lipoprotein-releasing ABC transporter permease subunit [SCandidatus Aminicenantes bacterium Aminicenantia_JdfR_composite]MCP2596464.1 lipoprotein-releasing ABC transporter permease subunit [Candidatus Aminicenantes bacterium AC-335-G13]MCP2598150.1 lipoprotein-releasing ABC transporter permease subunit [Candidatus Aminicenantes bacterium AC-335-L06]MCP2598916.1 lipoprotein-releasing ABC transporter permease subunit [Candidatus Aminicenantes bacterium AC-335-B20]MCP2603860.1 lipoprotein-relea
MKFEFFIAKRYLTAKRKQAFISVITFISILGITIGVMALIIAIALITGFQEDIQDKILRTTSHIMVSSLTGEGIKNYSELANKIKEIKGVESVTPVAYQTVLIKSPYKTIGAVLKGINFREEVKYSSWLKNLEEGKIIEQEREKPGILLGSEMAFNLGVNVGDTVTVLTTTPRLSPIGILPKMRRMVVVGIFKTGLYEFDSSTALISLSTAQKLFNLDNRIHYLQIKIEKIFDADKIAKEIKKIILVPLYITTWMELNKTLFSALKLEKNVLFLTITLIVLVAALNIIATLILMVMEKTKDIGILVSLGATSKNIKRIFFLQGAMIGVFGTFFGSLLGLLTCWIANTFKLIKVPIDIYQLSYIPFKIKTLDFLIIVGVALLISFLSTLFPSHRASKVDPVIALKYE